MGAFDEMAFRLQGLWQVTDNLTALGMYQRRDLDGTASLFRANVFTTGSNNLNSNYDRDTVFYDDGLGNPQDIAPF